MSAHTTTRRRVRRNALVAISAMFVVAQTVGAGHTSAQDADVDEPETMLYQTDPTPFTLDDIIGDTSGVTEGSSGDVVIGDDDGEDTSGNIVNGKNGGTMYPIDSAFTYDVLDFYGAVGRDRDGLPEEGWVGPVTTEIEGETLTGIQLSDVATDELKSGAPLGTWAAGLGDSSVKASTEHFTVMEGILTCHQTLPYDFWESEEDYFDDLADGLDSSVPADTTAALAELGLACVPLTDPTALETLDGETGDDVLLLLEPNEDFVISDMLVDPDRNYSVTKKDDGKLLFRWGQMVKRPTDIRFQKTLPLPEEWLAVPDGQKGYQVSKAELVVRHRITNNPNDQIRPEDWENEAATGWLPGYTTDADGYRYSDTGCYEGDGDYIPAGTIFKYPNGVTTEVPAADLAEGYTAAWYTTIDRDPFQWAYDTGTDVVGSRVPDATLGELVSGPRWRLTSNKFGQDLPGLEIPSEACTPPPYQQGETRYDTGEMTTTIINLLDWGDDNARWDDAVSPLAWSAGWTHTWATADVPGMVVEDEDAARCSIDLGDGNCVTELGTTLTENFDVTFYVKGDQKPLEVYDVQLILEYNEAPPVTEIYDFGDAPESYGEAAAIATGPTLGATIDADLAQQYSVAADGDDLTGVDDEDGVVLTADGAEATATITLTGSGYVQGWLDDDLSGTFDADELIVADLESSAAVTFPAPADDTYARFRLSTEPGAAPTGLSGSGEVEDYVVPAAIEPEPEPEPPDPEPPEPEPEPPEPEPVADFMTLTTPTRIFDTRTGYVAPDGRTVAAAMLEGGSDVVVPVVGRAGVPADAEAVMVNLTITGATEPGHATIWDCGDRPTTSSVNYATNAVANEVMVALSDAGTACVSTSSEAHVVVDLVAFAPLGSDYMVLTPTRVADTRVGFTSADGEFVGTGPVAGGSVVTIPLAGRAGVPEDAEAVMVNLTITGATAPGHATIAACGTVPITSSVNYTTGAYASEVFVKPSSRGDVCVYVHTTAHVVLDVVGAAPAGSQYDALTPSRVADTRVGFTSADGEFVGTGPVAGGSVVTIPLAGRAGVPDDAEAVMVNLTITGATLPGHATIWGCGTRPITSSVNYTTGAFANEVLVKPSAAGDVCVYVHSTAHVVLDVVGVIPAKPEI